MASHPYETRFYVPEGEDRPQLSEAVFIQEALFTSDDHPKLDV